MLGSSLTPEEAQFLCYPVALVSDVDGEAYAGCVTPRIPKPPYKKLVETMFNEKQACKHFQDGISWGTYLQIARGIARAVAVLNSKGCAHTDIDYLNFLVHLHSSSVVMLDLDGSVVPGFLPPQVLGKIPFMAPELITDHAAPSERSDRHSLAVLVLHTLLFRNVMKPMICYDPTDQTNDDMIGFGREAVFSEHPNDRRNRPSWLGLPLFERGQLSYRMLTPTLQKLTERAFLQGLHNVESRPSAQEWVRTLGWAVDELLRCSRCRLHSPYPYWIKPAQRRQCPFCGQRFTGNAPSVLQSYAPRSKGNYGFTGRHLVLGNGSKLYMYVLEPHRITPLNRSNEQSIGHVERDDTSNVNRLVNDEECIWSARLNGEKSIIKIGKDASVPLQPGVTVHFGEGRCILVVTE